MRLVCPNCGATYEVPDDVIPDGGRDVQCSNCNTTWFQMPAGFEPPQTDQADNPQSASVIEPTIDVPVAEPEEADAQDAPPDPKDEQPQATPPQPTMSPEAEEILRQEAEFAAQMRAADTTDFETQPDLGLDAGETPREAEVRDRLSKLKGIDPEEIAAVGAGAVAAAGERGTSRRELLPDIEEINSTLSNGEGADENGESYDPEKVEAKKRKGFRTGFIGVLLMFALLIALYLFAPQIKALVPALGGVLDSYTSAVDGFRLMLDGVLASIGGVITGWMESATDAVNSVDAPADN
ncbi:zinc-ribbon domain-containing protein [Nereida sp. MMG025]|uniref:zinc-ribbon domain-containing protein n=1 Tax=Nereida sp. MMG025 TaxID=2909981 RepID=UPI001F43CB4B|nr:zinc-ribbon domain-containing protein [Nereida sp. MMG025]MCF6444345.1 zinc-ribbon domain-containing protein [Nereida sp. MMG025]